MEIIEVNNNKELIEFINFPRKIYSADKNWVCPLDRDVFQFFDEKNPQWNHIQKKAVSYTHLTLPTN